MSYHCSIILLAVMAALADSESVDSTSTEVGHGGHLLYRFVKLVVTGQNNKLK
jgi:hypothetical protein